MWDELNVEWDKIENGRRWKMRRNVWGAKSKRFVMMQFGEIIVRLGI